MRAAAIPFLPCRAPAGPSLPRPKAYAAAMNFLYLTDVFCPWCYGFAPVMRRLAAEHPELPVRVLGGNLMAEPQTLTGMLEEYPTIREFFVRLQETTGQTTEQFRLALEQAAAGTGPDLLMHSPAMNLPLAALRQLSPGHQLEQMEAFQMAFYAQGRDVMAAGEQEAIAAAWLPAGAAPGALAAVMADPAVREAARHDAAEAEEIKDSTAWVETSRKFNELMDRWKKAGRAGRRDDDALWARFRAAADTFFNARQADREQISSSEKENLAKKEELLTKAEALVPVKDEKAAKQARQALAAIQEEWDQIGYVPRDDMHRIESRLDAVDKQIKAVEDAAWKQSDPEADARKSSFEEQLNAQLAELDAQIAAESDPKKKAKLEAEKATKEQWLNAIK